MRFAWDEVKNEANFRKHGVWFEEAQTNWAQLERLRQRRQKTMKKEYEISKLKKRPGKIKVDPEATKTPISIRLEGDILADIKLEADRLGIPYQTLIGSVLHRFVNGDLIDLKSVDLKELIQHAS